MSLAEQPAPTPAHHDAARRARAFRRARIIVIALVIGYFFLPYDLRSTISPWLPFLAALALEAHFFLGGYLRARRGEPTAAAPDRGPQPHDVAELGGRTWREARAVEYAGEEHLVPTEGLTEEEAEERIAAYLDDPEAALAEVERDEEAADTEYRRPRYLLEAAAAVAVVAAIVFFASRPHGWDAVPAENRARAEALFSREATRIADHPVSIGCDTSGDFVGFVQDADGLAFVGGTHAYLTPSICDTLYQLAFKHRVQSFPRTARAIAVLAHESWHLRGVRDEGLANCYGFQSGVQIGVNLGLSENDARAMMREQLATNASDVGPNGQYLVPKSCRDGGDYDLDPGSSLFP
jgi:hypothetical protein